MKTCAGARIPIQIGTDLVAEARCWPTPTRTASSTPSSKPSAPPGWSPRPLWGTPQNTRWLRAWGDAHGLALVEDCSHAQRDRETWHAARLEHLLAGVPGIGLLTPTGPDRVGTFYAISDLRRLDTTLARWSRQPKVAEFHDALQTTARDLGET